VKARPNLGGALDFGDALKLRRALKLDAAGAPRSHVKLLARRLDTTAIASHHA
jgi:hypothetical protein